MPVISQILRIAAEQWLRQKRFIKAHDAIVFCESSPAAFAHQYPSPPYWRKGYQQSPFYNNLLCISHLPECPLTADPNHVLTQQLQRLNKFGKAAAFRLGLNPALKQRKREKVIVLGTGWASLYFINQIDPTAFDVTVVSPRSYFVFTPLLTSALGGVLSPRSVIEPIRNKMLWGGRKVMEYLEGSAQDIDPAGKVVRCKDRSGKIYDLSYDALVVAIGSETATFGVPGVLEHSLFLKEIEDVHEIRLRMFNAFEKASLPGISDEEKRLILSFVVVGGGPAGVEAAAEMTDLIHEDIGKSFPHLRRFASVTVIEMLPRLLPMFGPEVSQFASESFAKMGINAMLEHCVTKIDDQCIHVAEKKAGKEMMPRQIPYGFVIWASGVGQVEFARTLMSKVPAQAGNKVVRVKPTLEVIGTDGVYALGDCASVNPPKLAARASALYREAAQSPVGAGMVWLKRNASRLIKEGYVQLHATQLDFPRFAAENYLGEEGFIDLCSRIDSNYRSPVATAQMARQAGAYLGACFNKSKSSHLAPAVARYPFTPITYGAFSYVGGGRAIVELTRRRNVPRPKVWRIMGGLGANFLWRGYYWLSQTSKYNKILSASDYLKTALKGRDVMETNENSTTGRQRKQ